MGIDPDTVLTYTPTTRLVPALVLPGLAVALAALNFLLSIAATWATARDSRSLTSTLIAIGLSPRLGRRIILWQCWVLNGVALTIGLALAVIPVAGIKLLLPAYDPTVPWTDIITLGSATVIGLLGAALLATMSQTARSRTSDM